MEWCQTIPNLPKLRKRSVMFQFSKFLTILVYLNVLKSWRLCFRVFIDSFQVCRMVQIFGLVDPPPERVIIRPINTIFGAYLHTNSMLWKWNIFFRVLRIIFRFGKKFIRVWYITKVHQKKNQNESLKYSYNNKATLLRIRKRKIEILANEVWKWV